MSKSISDTCPTHFKPHEKQCRIASSKIGVEYLLVLDPRLAIRYRPSTQLRMPKTSEIITIRKISREDLPEVSVMAGELVRWHHSLDDRRFRLVEGVEKGYERFFESQLEAPNKVLLVALMGEKRVGYAYAALEPADWNMLLDKFGALHDIYVVKEARRSGVGSALLEEVAVKLRALGAPRVVLSTAAQNKTAQSLFARHGFRPTMHEMTREL